MKVKLNENINSLIPENEYISKADIITLINSKINNSSILMNTEISISECREILIDIYRRFDIYIDLYSDIIKIFNAKTGKLKRVELKPYYFRIAIYNHNGYNQEPIYFYKTENGIFENETIRNYRIENIEETA